MCLGVWESSDWRASKASPSLTKTHTTKLVEFLLFIPSYHEAQIWVWCIRFTVQQIRFAGDRSNVSSSCVYGKAHESPRWVDPKDGGLCRLRVHTRFFTRPELHPHVPPSQASGWEGGFREREGRGVGEKCNVPHSLF